MAAVILQQRRGNYSNFDPSKLKPGEIAIIQSNDPNSPDGKAIYVCISSGVIKRIASIDELGDYNSTGEQILSNVRTIANNVNTQASQASTKAYEAAQSASQAEQAKQTTQQLASTAESTINNQTTVAIQRINDAADARKATIDKDGIIHL